MRRLTPMGVVILLQIHIFPYAAQQDMINDSVASDDMLKVLFRGGLICPEPRTPPKGIDIHGPRSEWNTTEKGRVHIQKLCALEFPEASWI